MTLSFSVPGKVASNNRVTRFNGSGASKSPEATSYQQRVFQYAFAAATTMGWKMPDACAVTIRAFNSRLDADNIAKCVLDGMAGAAYHDDKVVINLCISKRKDDGDQRIEVSVSPAIPLTKKRKAA